MLNSFLYIYSAEGYLFIYFWVGFIFKVLDYSVCSLFLEEGIKSEGQDFAGEAYFLYVLYILFDYDPL